MAVFCSVQVGLNDSDLEFHSSLPLLLSWKWGEEESGIDCSKESVVSLAQFFILKDISFNVCDLGFLLELSPFLELSKLDVSSSLVKNEDISF